MEYRWTVRSHPFSVNARGRAQEPHASGWSSDVEAKGSNPCGEPKARGQPRTKVRGQRDKKRRAGEEGCPYRKPTQVGGGKTPEADERTLVKELGKLAP